MRNFQFSSEKSLFARYFFFEFDTRKQANSERKAIPGKGANFPCSDRSGLKKKCEISNFPRKNHYSLAIFLFEFDTRKQANSERKAIPSKDANFPCSDRSGLKKKCEISNFPRKNRYSLAIFLFEFDAQKQANSERKAIFPIKVLIFLARIVRD